MSTSLISIFISLSFIGNNRLPGQRLTSSALMYRRGNDVSYHIITYSVLYAVPEDPGNVDKHWKCPKTDSAPGSLQGVSACRTSLSVSGLSLGLI